MRIGFDFVGVSTPFYCHDGEGHVLMHKRSAQCRDEHHRWDPGSGKLEHDLSLEENVLKEIQEEYGCQGIIEGRLPAHDIFREQGGERTHWIAVPFFVRVDRATIRIGEPHKMDELGWFDLDHLPQPLHTGFARTLAEYGDIFREYIRPRSA